MRQNPVSESFWPRFTRDGSITPKARFRLDGAMLGFIVIFSAICAGSSGATYFGIQELTGIRFREPLPLYAIASASALFGLGQVQPALVKRYVFLILLVSFFCVSYLWAPAWAGYPEEKLLKTLIMPPLLVVSGYSAMRLGGGRVISYAFAAYSTIIAAAVFSGNGVVDSLERLLVADPEVTLDYQRFGILMGLTSALLVPLLFLRRSKVILTVMTTMFAVLALVSGGRMGAGMVAIGGLAYAAWKVGPKFVGALTVFAGALILISYQPLIEIVEGVALAADAPDTIMRALTAAQAPPELTRIWGRPELYKAAIEVWLAHPVFGGGWGAFQARAGLPDIAGFYPHNIFAELLAETGILGFAAFLVLAKVVVSDLLSITADNVTSRINLTVAATLVVAGFVTSLFIGDFYTQYALFLGIGGTWCLVGRGSI